ncbi:hypothetical protein AVEN_258172-1 [Araneus ventricosus]|uniref:Uncharacterized protein n=1 Tax=Araneus ventricosus TaxID=182803 RepID=A0A4Y2GIN7_ARAVE|nr:hypothetical protein AVEN_258172-1 [Araneus ventricosus]
MIDPLEYQSPRLSSHQEDRWYLSLKGRIRNCHSFSWTTRPMFSCFQKYQPEKGGCPRRGSKSADACCKAHAASTPFPRPSLQGRGEGFRTSDHSSTWTALTLSAV